MPRFVFILIVVCVFSLPIPAVGQLLGVDGETQFRRQLDSFFWNYRTGFNVESSTYDIRFQNVFTSRFYLFDGEPQNIQDENNATLSATYQLNSSFFYTTQMRSYRFTSADVKQDFGMMGVGYTPNDLFKFRLMGGIIRDERNRVNDSGPMIGFRANTAPYNLGDFLLQSSAHIDYGDISPRTFQNWRFNTLSLFEVDNFNLETDFQLARNVRDSYQASSFFNRQQSDLVESVQTDTTGVLATAGFPLFDVVQTRIQLGYLNNVRTVTNNKLNPEIDDILFDTRIFRQNVDLGFSFMIPFNRSQFNLGLNYSVGSRDARLINTDGIPDDQVRRRTDILLNSNFDQSRLELFTNNTLRLSELNVSQITGRVAITRYDTPTVNRDDRDELFYQLRLSNRHNFSEFFRSTITLAGESTHTVYLFSERSIENNWRHSIRLIPELEWDPTSWLRLRQRFLVRANYTIDDFELEGRPRNDQVSREFSLQSSAEITLAPEWWLELSGSRNELRIGRLLWEDFSEIPTDTLITYDSRMMVTHRTGQLISSVGVRYFYKRDYIPQTTVVLTENLPPESPTPVTRIAPGLQKTVQWGPMVEMRLPLYRNSELFVNGWYQMQAVRQTYYLDVGENLRAALRAEERRANRRTFPNIEIRARFRF